MSVIDLPDGGKGRVCDPVKWAIYPEEYQKLEEWSRNSPEGKTAEADSRLGYGQ
jgi:hypothetical protein